MDGGIDPTVSRSGAGSALAPPIVGAIGILDGRRGCNPEFGVAALQVVAAIGSDGRVGREGKTANKTTDKRCSRQFGANRWHHSAPLVPASHGGLARRRSGIDGPDCHERRIGTVISITFRTIAVLPRKLAARHLM